ncbi:hypothetical protein BYT27DRAFT_6748044 [Phlegmacium glaucopus]|nr:hypothetical protein BYT27DRAFT_6748044 [Phlegmacium glaucopus]
MLLSSITLSIRRYSSSQPGINVFVIYISNLLVYWPELEGLVIMIDTRNQTKTYKLVRNRKRYY